MEENKFNFSEEITKEHTDNKTKAAVSQDAKGLLSSLKNFMIGLLDFRQDTDRAATIEAIKGDLSFKGATAWILICSIFVASVGLNANSTAVVIGAMLIAPLMGPILGMGLSIAINDVDTLRRSLINLVVMVVLSLLTAFLFFWIFPLNETNSELLGRTRPDIRDVLIAFFGGLALIIARTKKGTIASVIFGVAIATALMPPLCTAGYGLAMAVEEDFFKGIKYAGGAMYLFTINTIFIALATFIVLKLLRFPMLRYANSRKRRRISRLAYLIAIIIMIYPITTFITVLNESKVKNQITNFIKNEIKANPSLQLLDDEFDEDEKVLSLSFFNEISEATLNDLENEWNNNPLYPNLSNYKLKIKGSDTKSYDIVTEAYRDKKEALQESKNIISGLQLEIESLKEEISQLNNQIEEAANSENDIQFSSLAKEAKIRFKELKYFSYGEALTSDDFIKVDTVLLINVKWDNALADSLKTIRQGELTIWLKNELKSDKIMVNVGD